MDEIKHLIKKHKVKDYGMLICIIVLMVFNVLIEINPMSNEGIKKYSWYYQFLTADKKVYEIPTDELSEKLIYDVSTDSLSERYASDNNGDYFICEMRDSEGETKFLVCLHLTK